MRDPYELFDYVADCVFRHMDIDTEMVTYSIGSASVTFLKNCVTETKDNFGNTVRYFDKSKVKFRGTYEELRDGLIPYYVKNRHRNINILIDLKIIKKSYRYPYMSTPPRSPVVGMMWINNSTNEIMYYTEYGWKKL